MTRVLDDYILDARTRYEGHTLLHTPEDGETIAVRGFLAAAVLAALLVDTDEGEARAIALDTDEQRRDFFMRYEKEVRRDNGGLLTTEVQALNNAYIEFTGSEELLARICRNDRLFDLAVGLVIEYMQRLVREEVKEHIYDYCPWTGPFAQWLFNAGYVESRRQYLLSIDWTDAAAVFALSEQITNNQSPINKDPLFVFDGLSSDQVVNGYWNWLWGTVQREANQYPDAKVRLAQYKQIILEQERNYDFLKPEMKDFTAEQLNLFRAWMNQWTGFVERQIEPINPKSQKKEEKQLFYPDEVLKCPAEDDPEKYAATREYIKERKRYDPEFRKYAKNTSHAGLCRQLTMLFGWYVDPSSLRKSLLRSPKRPTKKYT